MTKHIAILRGDGIGPEIVAETVRVLDKLIAQGLDVGYEYAPLGGEAYDEYGHPYPNLRKTFAVKPMPYYLVQSVLRNTTILTVRCALSAACWPSVKT